MCEAERSIVCGLVRQCNNVRAISTLSGLAQLHLFRGFYNSPHNECFHIIPWPVQKIRLIRQIQFSMQVDNNYLQ